MTPLAANHCGIASQTFFSAAQRRAASQIVAIGGDVMTCPCISSRGGSYDDEKALLSGLVTCPSSCSSFDYQSDMS